MKPDRKIPKLPDSELDIMIIPKKKVFPLCGCCLLLTICCLFVLLLVGCNNISTEIPDNPDTSSSLDMNTNDFSTQTEASETGEYSTPEDNFYTNRASAAKFYQDIAGNTILYSNVYDNNKLYKYDITSDTRTELSHDIYKVQFISIVADKIYFSGSPADNISKINIYSMSADSSDIIMEIMEIEDAKGAILTDEYIYYHDAIDEFAFGISRKNILTGITEMLVNGDYQCSDMTMNIVDDDIFFHNLFDIFKYNITTGEITNLTSGKYNSGINKLQYINGYLYYYTFDKPSSIKRINAETLEEEDILTFNNGDFWYDVLLINSEYIVFTGRQFTPLKADEPKETFVTGTFRYSFETGDVIEIYDTSLGPTCYMADNFIIALLNEEDTGANQIVTIDYEGKNLNDMYPGLS